ncbi:MAG: hypothetical protein EP330_30525 [Deltaproteobacteria bacterium]|nr:MAG: hypothetical protein EP330_30525 [Deltaproteobacteria bacterium]
MVLLFVALLAHAELWGSTNGALADHATLIARASAADGRWVAVDVVRGDLARMPAEALADDGDYLVVCDALMCPRALGKPVDGGWVLNGREWTNGAVISPGVVRTGEEATLGFGPDCVRTSAVQGQAFSASIDGPQGALRVWDFRGPEVSVPLGATTLALRGDLTLGEECWQLAVSDTNPPLRDAADLAHFAASTAPVLWAEGELERDGRTRDAKLWMDGYGQLLVELDGQEPVESFGARSVPRMGGTRWMFRIEDEHVEIAIPPSGRDTGSRAVAEQLAEGPREYAVYREDGDEVVGRLRLHAP